MIQSRLKAGKLDLAREAVEKRIRAAVDFYGEKHWATLSARTNLTYLDTLANKSEEERRTNPGGRRPAAAGR